MTISTDTAILGRIIDIKIWKPVKAKFKYSFIDNSGQKERFSVPGPSDYRLEAVLYFDSLTYDKILTGYIMAGVIKANFDKREFAFDWLDDDIKKEVNKADTSYKGSPDYLFGSKYNGGIWFTDKKILVLKLSD